VLLTTHYLDEADALCDRLVIVDHGTIVAEGTPSELKRQIAGDVVILRLDGAADAGALLKAQSYVRDIHTPEHAGETTPYGHAPDGDGGLRVYVDDGEHVLPHLLRLLEEQGLTIRSISLDRATLDDVFLSKTGRSLRDAA
jgi:ABC-2 type transport system ATP-binding protein